MADKPDMELDTQGTQPGSDLQHTSQAPGANPDHGNNDGAALDLDGMTLEELHSLLASDNPAESLSSNPAEPKTGDGESANQDGDDVEPQATNDGQDAAKPQKRIRMNLGDLPESEVDRMFQLRDMVKRGEAKDIFDAVEKMRGANAEPGSPPPTTETEVRESPKVQEIQQRIETLKQERNKARTVDFDYEKADAISDEIAALLVEARDAERDAQTQAQETSTWATQEAEALAEIVKTNPELRDEGSELYAEYAAQHALAMASGDKVFNSPDWPKQLVQRAQNRLARLTGGKHAPAKSQPARTIPPPPQPAKPSRPVGSLGTTGTDGPQLSQQEYSRLIDSAPLEVLQEAMSAPDMESTVAILMRARK